MSDSDSLPLISDSDCSPVPVFNCCIILSKDPSATKVLGRVANLSGLSSIGSTERDVLMQLTKQFKQTVQTLTERGQSIPWIDPPEQPAAGESQRFVPVHL